MRPDERLPTKRTASIGSRVPPAVTRTFSPSSEPPAVAPTRASIAASSSEGSGRRPTPHSPGEPSAPVPGSSTSAPRARRVSRFARVAAFSYIASFMAGATISGRRHASAAAVSRLSAWPWASLAIVLADAGAIMNRSARSTSARCESGACSGAGSPGKAPRNASASHSLISTGAPVMAAKDAVPTKRVEASVWITRTACPAFMARRVSSSAL